LSVEDWDGGEEFVKMLCWSRFKELVEGIELCGDEWTHIEVTMRSKNWEVSEKDNG